MPEISDVRTVRLTVNVEDPAAELLLIGPDLIPVDWAYGTLNSVQRPGIYKLKMRLGDGFSEQLVSLVDQPVELKLGKMTFDSPVPMEKTRAFNREHLKFLVQVDTNPTDLGATCEGSLLLFLRALPPETGSSELGSVVERLTLVDYNAALARPAKEISLGSFLKIGDGCAGARIRLPSGIYGLRASCNEKDWLEQVVSISPGWATQVFCWIRRNADICYALPDQSSEAILMAPDEGRQGQESAASPTFDPGSTDARLLEAARTSLRSLLIFPFQAQFSAGEGPSQYGARRQVMELLGAKFSNPLLGLLAGHIMLRAGDPDRGLLGMVVSNLRSMLQSDADADVEALALELGDTKHVFEFPPMLRASWRLILKHAEARPEIVPVNGLSARVASQTVISDFWLVWRGGDRAEELEYEREMVKHLQGRAQALFKREEEWRSGAARTSPARSLISLATPMPDNDSVPGVPIVGHDERTVGASWIPKSRLLKLSEDPGDLE